MLCGIVRGSVVVTAVVGVVMVHGAAALVLGGRCVLFVWDIGSDHCAVH